MGWSPDAGEIWLSPFLGPLAKKNLTFSVRDRAEEFLLKIWGGRSSSTMFRYLEPKAAERGSCGVVCDQTERVGGECE